MTDDEAVIDAPSEVPLTEPEPTQGAVRYAGVGGWLLFFCVSLTVLNPALTLYNVVSGFIGSMAVFGQNLGYSALLATDWLVSLAIGMFSLYAGISLWRIHPKAVQTARVFLFVGMIYTVVAPFSPLLLDLTSSQRSAVLSAAVIAAGRGSLYYVIWLNYLMQSKRVASTYADWVSPLAGKKSVGAPVRWYHVLIAVGAVVGIFAAAAYVSAQ